MVRSWQGRTKPSLLDSIFDVEDTQMNLIKSEKLEKSMHELQFSIEGEAFKAATAAVFKREGKKYTVQGFRKGKAPRALIEKMYGADVFTYDAINDLFPAAYEAAIQEAGIEVVGRPEVTIDSASEQDGVVLTVKVPVKPEVKLGAYNGLNVEKIVHTVEDSAVEVELKRVQERNARELTRDGAAQNGDIADIDFEGFVDGVAFEGGKAEHYALTLGSGSFIPGFEEQVVGHSAGEEFDVNVTFPTEYQAEELAGKAAVFKIKLHEVKYKELPALDDDLAKDCSDYDTLDEFKASIRKSNQEELDKQDELAVENALVDQVIEGMEAEIPQAMYDARMDEMVNDFAYRVEQQGLSLDTYLKYMGQTTEQFRASFMPQAEKQVKIRLALEAVAAAENIVASDEEVDAEIKRIADQYKMEEDKVRELVNINELKNDLAVNKAIDFVKSHANVVEKAAEAASDAE
jgi:trigger factor